jgi:transposase-like protein
VSLVRICGHHEPENRNVHNAHAHFTDSRRKYSLELKTRAICYVLENGLPVAQVARDLDIDQASHFASFRKSEAGQRRIA